MTLLTNSIFAPVNKAIRFSKNDLAVISGANTLATMDLCSFKLPWKQYQRISVQVPAGASNYALHFPMLGIEVTFLAIVPKFCGTDKANNYLKWKFQASSDAKWTMTSLMMLTGSVNSPIPTILIDNPNTECSVQIDILVSGMDNDYLNDTSAFLYLKDLIFTAVQTYEQTTSGILALYNSSNVLSGTLNISDIINVTKVEGMNRIIIDEASSDNVVLDFTNEYNALQALSALTWLLQDPGNRFLPQAADVAAPVITYTHRVVSNAITIDLSLFTNNYRPIDIINDAILSVVDARDGSIVPTASTVSFTQGSSQLIAITNPGTYAATFTIKDIAGNQVIQTIVVNAMAIIVDAAPPVITHTGNVSGGVATGINLNNFSNVQFSYTDARNYCIASVTDNVDGLIPLQDVGVLFFDQNMVPVAGPITAEGSYYIQFQATDSHANTTTELISIAINDPNVDSAPKIKFTGNMNAIAMSATISLATNYGSGAGIFTEADAIARFVTQVTDDIDGTIITNATNVFFFNGVPSLVTFISTPGVYTVRFSFTDTGLNTTIKTIVLTVTA